MYLRLAGINRERKEKKIEIGNEHWVNVEFATIADGESFEGADWRPAGKVDINSVEADDEWRNKIE